MNEKLSMIAHITSGHSNLACESFFSKLLFTHVKILMMKNSPIVSILANGTNERDQPSKLSSSEKEKPVNVFKFFFDNYLPAQAISFLQQCKKNLSDPENDSPAHRDTMVEDLEKLIEAAYVMQDDLPAATSNCETGEGFTQCNHTTMKQSATFKQDTTVEKIIELISIVVKPERIFMFSYSGLLKENNKKYVDLFITIPDTSQRSFNEYESFMEMICLDNEYVHYSLHKSKDMKKYLEEGHMFYSTVCVPENVVYDDGKTKLPIPIHLRMKDVLTTAKKHFSRGFQKAKTFLWGAITYFESNEREIVSFMIQQTVELTLRTVILGLTGIETKTHSMAVLQKHCLRCAPILNTIFPGNSPNEIRILQILDSAYLNARYNENFSVDNADLSLLIERTQLLLSIAQEVYLQKINEFEKFKTNEIAI